jgi:tRNA dimethylallyltransferase
MQKVLVIVGPTASGKSALAVALAKKFDGEVISADSRQVYRGLDIGTGKITKREMKGVAHHLLDVASPKRNFSAGDFAKRARAAIASISKLEKLAVLAGGTGFYIDALLGRIPLPEVKPDPKLRARLQKRTAAQLYALLKTRDPKRAKLMDTPSERNNKVRLIRALEIAAVEVGPRYFAEVGPRHNALWVGIRPTQKEMERRIRTRLEARMRLGLVAEGKRLHAGGLSYKRMEELGLEYRALSQLLQNEISREDFEEELFRNIRRYAKKQLAYWKRNKAIRWYAPQQKERVARDVAAWLRTR